MRILNQYIEGKISNSRINPYAALYDRWSKESTISAEFIDEYMAFRRSSGIRFGSRTINTSPASSVAAAAQPFFSSFDLSDESTR